MEGKDTTGGSFLWGVATSAFQLEGAPCADWTNWDCALRARPEIAHHYKLFRDDLKLLKELGVNAYRFSTEWSRIQPTPGAWDQEALDHYGEIIQILRDLDVEPMVTIHHFTHPIWFLERHPWHEDGCIPVFLEYVNRVLSTMPGVRYWITFNEPYVLLLGGYLEGCMPPGIRDLDLAVRALRNILICHGMAYELIHARCPHAQVSVAHNMAAIAPWSRWNPLDVSLCRVAKHFYNHSLLDAFATGELVIQYPLRRPMRMDVPVKGRLDFLGVNYYTRLHLRFNPFRRLGVELRHRDLEGLGLTDMGWEIHPHGLEKVLRYASRLGVPIIITENGIATRDSRRKSAFMKRHIDVVEKCLRGGMDIRGYFYWSLMDNYEWLRGLDARFGLYRVDFDTLQREPTPAATYYADLIRDRTSIFNCRSKLS